LHETIWMTSSNHARSVNFTAFLFESPFALWILLLCEFYCLNFTVNFTVNFTAFLFESPNFTVNFTAFLLNFTVNFTQWILLLSLSEFYCFPVRVAKWWWCSVKGVVRHSFLGHSGLMAKLTSLVSLDSEKWLGIPGFTDSDLCSLSRSVTPRTLHKFPISAVYSFDSILLVVI